MLVLNRTWLHLAALARTTKPACMDEWTQHMREVHSAAYARHLKLESKAGPLPDIGHDNAWARIDGVSQGAAGAVAKRAKRETGAAMSERRRALCDELNGKSGVAT
eukprot:5949374-Alexandrium_andersonii.AAC.1